jgi:hypothetical protein
MLAFRGASFHHQHRERCPHVCAPLDRKWIDGLGKQLLTSISTFRVVNVASWARHVTSGPVCDTEIEDIVVKFKIIAGKI